MLFVDENGNPTSKMKIAKKFYQGLSISEQADISGQVKYLRNLSPAELEERVYKLVAAHYLTWDTTNGVLTATRKPFPTA